MAGDGGIRDDIDRFQELLGLRPGADVQMVLLKGHLLIEEQLQSYVDQVVPNKEALQEARLSFHQRLALAQALHPAPTRFGSGWVWASVRALNVLRNQMVHNVLPKAFDEQLEAFAATIERELPFPVTRGEGAEYTMAKFGMMLSFLNARLSQLLHSGRSVSAGGA